MQGTPESATHQRATYLRLIPKAGIVGKYRFKGIIGMSHDGEDFYGFETWNGQKPVIILDESGTVLGLGSTGEKTRF